MADHRPGGLPLLGTVAQLECLAQRGCEMMGGAKLVSLRNISIEAPFIITDGKPADILVSIVADADKTTLTCALTSHSERHPVTHLRATLTYAPDWKVADHVVLKRAPPRTVSSQQVYGCYFHGPAFQVIRTAARQGAALCAESVTALPGWSDKLNRSGPALRLIEFGLQTAGLLHLATDGVMLIPKTIARIDRFAAADLGDGTAYVACAGLSRSGTGVDIAIATSAGAPMVSISGYHCEPLPFAHDSAAVRSLAALLNATQPAETI